ncbi:MAG: hypothetical protein ABSB56_04530 [Nitrososphaerales archaeon]
MGHRQVIYAVIAIIVVMGSIAYVGYVQEVANQPVCSGESTSQVTPHLSHVQALYDEQQWLEFDSNFTTLEYSVTAMAQTDFYGFGPAYLLNGLASSGYWYQVGISYNWVRDNYSEFFHGFSFFYEVWDARTNASIYPPNGRSGNDNFSGIVNSGDSVQLSLTFASGNVRMMAEDLSTHANRSSTDFAYGATFFVKGNGKYSTYPSSLLTEWYHVAPYFCSPVKVTFTTGGSGISSGTLHIDQWNFTCVPLCTPFNATDKRELTFSSPWQYYQLSNDLVHLSGLNATIYASSSRFVTM